MYISEYEVYLGVKKVYIESKILPEDRRLYKDDLNVSKSHRYLEMIFRRKAVNCFERDKQYLKLYPGFNRKPMQTTKKG